MRIQSVFQFLTHQCSSKYSQRDVPGFRCDEWYNGWCSWLLSYNGDSMMTCTSGRLSECNRSIMISVTYWNSRTLSTGSFLLIVKLSIPLGCLSQVMYFVICRMYIVRTSCWVFEVTACTICNSIVKKISRIFEKTFQHRQYASEIFRKIPNYLLETKFRRLRQ